MEDKNSNIRVLSNKIDKLERQQLSVLRAIGELRTELVDISREDKVIEPKSEVKPQAPPIKQKPLLAESAEVKESIPTSVPKPIPTPISAPKSKDKIDLEKFIGENLISKIGILITIIGVMIGVKYSIDHDLINPLTRVILGYLSGISLLIIGFKLKKKYINYSSILVGGAMAVMYIVSYIAYSMFDLITLSATFLLMFIFTIFTVLSALTFNKQVIAHIGLIGAYAVPFILSNETVPLLYIAGVNIGILFISFKKDWRALYYAASFFTWIIVTAWYNNDYHMEEQFSSALLYITFFYLTFYTTFIAHKVKKNKEFKMGDIVRLLSNSLIYFTFGYLILDEHTVGSQFLGAFAVLNGAIHFGVSTILYRKKQLDKGIFYLIIGLAISFISIAIPIQLDQKMVTLLWGFEALLLFWIGRTKKIDIYEKLSYAVIAISIISFIQDYYQFERLISYAEKEILIWDAHIQAALGVIFALVFSYMFKINRKMPSPKAANPIRSAINFIIPTAAILSIYSTIYVELIAGLVTNEVSISSKFAISTNYTIIFLSVLTLINIKYIKNLLVSRISIIISIYLILAGLTLISNNNDTISNLSYLSLIVLLYTIFKSSRKPILGAKTDTIFDIIISTVVMFMLSTKVIDLSTNRLHLSIIWSVYALGIVALGIWKKRKHLRVVAIVIFGITVAKLFLFDISYLGTISKTIIFISTGVLLLIASFLYNKYQNKISNE